MAWSNGNKRWTVPFMSLNGTSCRVDIYMRGYSGSTVDTLTGAANPFVYEENDSEDLLNDIIRYRTGYLRIIEENYGDLDEIYPSVNTDRYIEFYYGSTLDFVGYIMAQEFQNSWDSGPRVLELPVISPIGLASGTKLDWSVYNPPSWITIRQVIRDSLNMLDGGYTGFYFPQYMPSQPSLDNVVNGLYINSLLICPFAGKYNKNGIAGDLTGIYEAKTVEEALTIVCTGFGLILHDVPISPIFQRVDYQDDYVLFGFNGSRQLVQQSTTDMTSIAEVADAENTESVVMPLSKIEVTYEGDENIPKMTFNRCHGYARGCVIEEHEFCTNLPNIADFSGTFDYALSIDANGMIMPDKVCLGAYGSDSLAEMVLFRPAENDGWGTGYKICSYTFYEWYGDSMRLRFRHRYGESIENMNNPQYDLPLIPSFYATIGVLIKTGDMWYSPQSGWVAITPSTTYTKSWDDGRVDCEIGFIGNRLITPQPLVIEFYAVDGNISDWIHAISDVSLDLFESASDAYLNKNKEKNAYTVNGDPSYTEGSVDRGFSINARNTNRLRFSDTVITGSAEVDIQNNEPHYEYLMTAQDRLKLDVNMTYQTPATIYLNRLTLWGSINKWRTIAHSFSPWDDLHRFTFHHSVLFDY